MIKLNCSRSILSHITMVLLLLFSTSTLLSQSQLQFAPEATSTNTLFPITLPSLSSPSSSSSSIVMTFAQIGNNTTAGNTLTENSNNDTANTATQSNGTGNRTIARWISLGPIPQVTQSNETANNGNSNTDTASTTTITTNASGKGVQVTDRATDPAILQQTSKVPIPKEEAIKAEQEANIMIEAYYEKVEQEKRGQAAALAAAQANQTTQATDTIEGSAASDEMETEGEEEDQDDEEGNEEGDENENGNDEEG